MPETATGVGDSLGFPRRRQGVTSEGSPGGGGRIQRCTGSVGRLPVRKFPMSHVALSTRKSVFQAAGTLSGQCRMSHFLHDLQCFEPCDVRHGMSHVALDVLNSAFREVIS